VLVILNFLIFTHMKNDQRIVDVKEKYRILREHLKQTNDPHYDMLHREIPIVAHTGKPSAVGYNTNKGAEIGICIDGTPNEIFHVLLHELAHSMVREYSHSDDFWARYEKLKNEAVAIGVYESIRKTTPFCGQKIRDK
tara:strand:+ start:5547 stop:5960 length:414 start_codon:yes stop_codon:yes gene_type:complete